MLPSVRDLWGLPMFKKVSFLPLAVLAATLVLSGGAMAKPLQSPGSIRSIPDGGATITTPSAGSSRLNGHAKVYRMCFWTAPHPHPPLPTQGYCLAPAGGDPGTPCTCRTEYGKYAGVVG